MAIIGAGGDDVEVMQVVLKRDDVFRRGLTGDNQRCLAVDARIIDIDRAGHGYLLLPIEASLRTTWL
ncbi:hypothetical protein [Mesorhizobium sp. INR15]|uniref:hypothetical protein n=1 Tax=Mesorhizobium sp. INR15 TaxID=2654248 RepID=UPI0018965A1C|nr:hypothetical protein [Mesorhizobium sp. INR15]QPC89207.1 hypothetical protein GA829_00595 [Mesorhizobium sp. INR15]